MKKNKKYVVCDECGCKYDITEQFCPDCLTENDEFYNEEDEEIETRSDIVKCKICGGIVSPNVKFCPHCGEQMYKDINDIDRESEELFNSPTFKFLNELTNGETKKRGVIVCDTFWW